MSLIVTRKAPGESFVKQNLKPSVRADQLPIHDAAS